MRPRSNCFYRMRSGFAIAALGLLVAALIMTPQAALAIPRQEGASAAMARLHVEELALGIGPRPAGTMRESAAADYVAEVLEEYGYAVSRVPFSRETADGVSVSENVIAVSPTAKPGARIVLIGASLDTCGLDSPGADHNASGLAAMLEAARLLSGLPGRGRSEVAFAAFGSNEMGRAGAKAFTEGKGAGPVDPRDVAMMINVDAVGRGDSVRLIPWGGPQAFPPKAFERLAEAVAGSTGLRVEFDTVIAMMPQVHTDHSPFLVTGTPAVTITTARSLPYYRSDSLEPYRDVASEASGANVARAADGVVAAARWAASAYSIGKPGDTYISFRMLGEIVSIPYVVSLVLAAIAVFAGVVCIAYARSLLMDEFSWVQSAGLIHAIGMSAAMYAITAVLIWTAFLPSAVVEAVRGLERPWNAYPLPYTIAGAVCALFSAVLILSLTGTRLRETLRIPILRLSMILQIAFVCLSVAIMRAGALPFALGLAFTAVATFLPGGFGRKAFAFLAPVPAAWLVHKAAVGVGSSVFQDLLSVPVFLSLLASAVALPYVMAIAALLSEPAGRRGSSYVPGSMYEVPPGTTLREYKVAPGLGGTARRRRKSARAAFIWILGVLTLVLTGSLFFYPVYTASTPQPVLVTHLCDQRGGHSLAFESTDNIRGVSVVSRSGVPGPARIDERSPSHVLPYSFSAPQLELITELDGSVMKIRLSPGAPIRTVRICVSGSEGLAVLSSQHSYEAVVEDGTVRVSTVLSGEEPIEAQFELAFPIGESLFVEAMGSFVENPAPVIISGEGKRFYETNRFTISTQITTG